MKINKIIGNVLKKTVNKSASDIVSNPDVKPIVFPDDDSKKNTWKYILQIIISILTAIITALGATSCINNM